LCGCASGAAVTPADGSVAAGVRGPDRTWVSRQCACVLGVCGGVRPRYGAFRDYSGSLVYVESGQRGRPKILHDSQMLLVLSKKKRKET